MKLTNLKKEDFENILEDYDIGKYKSNEHIPWALANTIYLLRTTKGKFILKIFEEADLNFIDFQIKIMQFLEKKKVPVQKIIKSKIKKTLFIYKKKRILIYKYIEGKEPKKFNKELIKDIVKNQTVMNKFLLKLELTGKYTWGKNYQFKPMKFKIQKYKDFDINKEDKKIIISLNRLNRKKLRKSVVHGDFHGANLLVRKNKLVAVIDWDDAHEDFISQEIANFIAHSFIEQKYIKKKQIKLYLKEYQKQIKLNDDEKKAIYYFIKNRWLTASAWHIKQLQTHKDRAKDIIKFITKTQKRYNHFNKISLEEFLSWC